MNSNLLLIMALLVLLGSALGQDSTKRSGLEICGFAQLDAGYDFNQINPAWSDALRVTKLPSYANQYALYTAGQTGTTLTIGADILL